MGEPWKDSKPCTCTLWQVNDQEGLSLTPWLCSLTKGASKTQRAAAQTQPLLTLRSLDLNLILETGNQWGSAEALPWPNLWVSPEKHPLLCVLYLPRPCCLSLLKAPCPIHHPACPSATPCSVWGDPELPGVTARLCWRAALSPCPPQAQQRSEEIPEPRGSSVLNRAVAPRSAGR